jgi:uncharacterized protein (TIGR02145 family)
MSKPSNTVVVQVDPNAGAGTISVPDFYINDNPVTGGSMNICSGGMLNLKVRSPQPNETYTWYHNNTSIGQGKSITYSISGATGSFVLRCQATGAGCSQEKSVQLSVSVGSRPDRPYITVSNPGNALCGGSAQLTANVSGTTNYDYIWYYSSNGSSYSQMTEQTQSITINKLGYYKVAVKDGSCVSEFSGEKYIAVSSAVTIASVDGPTTAKSGETKTYSAILDNPQGATYEWSISLNTTNLNHHNPPVIPSDAATIVGGKNGSSVVVAFKNTSSSSYYIQVKLDAYNACGAAVNNGVGSYYEVEIEGGGSTTCTGPLVSPNNNISEQIIKVQKGQTLSLSVNGDGSPVLQYQWYKDNSPISSNATTNVFVKNNVTVSDEGAYECRVTSTCNNMTVRSRTFRVKVEKDPAQLPLGEGSLSGRTCFDIAETANGTDCGNLSVRSSSKANFAGLSDSDKTYTFTATTTNVRNVHFVVVDNEKCVESTSDTQPLGTGSLSKGSSVRLTVNYKTTLNRADSDPKIQGRSRSQAAVVMIYAVYSDGSIEVAVPLKVTIQDCMCCGAMVAQNVWKAFMCHNLGAEQSADPFTPSYATNGAYYQWGRKDMAASAPNMSGADVPTISWNQTVPGGYYGNGSNDANATVKSAYDPCPAGFRVPNYNEFQGLINNNTKSYVGSWTSATDCSTCWAGVKFGDGLMLPAAGLRDGTGSMAGVVRNRGKFGGYWSSTKSSGYRDAAFRLYMEQGGIKMDNGSSGNINGTSVRCIAE